MPVSLSRTRAAPYFPSADWRSRHSWLERKGVQHGFEVITVHCSAKHLVIEKQSGHFSVDDTLFTGVLKVVDYDKYNAALLSGIGNTARAFGFGMLVI